MTKKADTTIEPINADFDDVVGAIIDTGGQVPAVVHKATHSGDVSIGSFEISSSVLEDGTRVLSQRGISTAFTGNRGGGTNSDGAQNLPRFLATKDVKPFISSDLMARLSSPIEYQPLHGGRTAFGYEASLLPEFCEVILDADDAGLLKNEKLAASAKMLIRGLARIGIIALVDEATGYQYDREKDALQMILEQYLSDEKRKWSKTFPDEFWFKLIKVKGKDSYYAMNRPSYVGHWVNDIVYSRLAPGVKAKLNELNPRLPSGRRKGINTQWLTDDYGLPELKDHLKKVMVLMDASSSQKEFERLLNKSLPKYGDTIELDLDNPNDD